MGHKKNRYSRLAQIDKTHLENLYAVEKLTIKDIAAAFDVCATTIRKALKLHEIPKRRAIRNTGKYTDLLNNLNIGEHFDFQTAGKHPTIGIYKTAASLGIRVTILNLGSGKFRVRRIEENHEESPAHERIDKGRLEELYFVEKLSVEKIAEVLGWGEGVIARALKYHSIPKRPSIDRGGLYVETLRSLAIGNEAEISSEAKYALFNLHSAAYRLGIMISVQSLGGNRFKVKRVEKDLAPFQVRRRSLGK